MLFCSQLPTMVTCSFGRVWEGTGLILLPLPNRYVTIQKTVDWVLVLIV